MTNPHPWISTMTNPRPWISMLRACRYLSDLRAPEVIQDIARPAIEPETAWRVTETETPYGLAIVVVGIELTNTDPYWGGTSTFYVHNDANEWCAVTGPAAHSRMPLTTIRRQTYSICVGAGQKPVERGLILLHGWRLDEDAYWAFVQHIREP